MKNSEMLKRLNEFAEYLDNMESSKEKAKLSRFFIGYMETMRAYHLYGAMYDSKFKRGLDYVV